MLDSIRMTSQYSMKIGDMLKLLSEVESKRKESKELRFEWRSNKQMRPIDKVNKYL